MIYRFQSQATGDVVMLGPNGDELLRLLGREPAPKGIIEVASMPAAIATLQAAVDAAEAAADGPSDDGEPEAGDAHTGRGVSLRQRLWPMLEMLRRAQAENAPVVWGV